MCIRDRASDQLYTVPTAGGSSHLLLPTPALEVSVSPDGNQLLYDNRPVYENEFRKGAVSDGTRDIWLFDRSTQKHRQLTTHRGEDRDAFWAPDGKGFYFLSERGSSFNVWPVSYTHLDVYKRQDTVRWPGHQSHLQPAWPLRPG